MLAFPASGGRNGGSMTFRKAILAVGLLGMPIAAHAQPISGLYLGAGAGVNFMQNETGTSIDGGVTPGNWLELGTGAAAVGAVGWGFGNGLRTELEFDYRYN